MACRSCAATEAMILKDFIMRPLFTALGLALAAMTVQAHADCRGDVSSAFAKQREAKAFRMEADVISVQGPMKMTVDYVLPDRIRQKVVIAVQPQPVEAVLIGLKAWANEGKGWAEAPADIKEELDKQLRAVAEETPDQLVDFECMGKQMIDGVELAAYRAQEGPKDMSPGADKKPKSDTTRIIYVDPAKGLPVRTIIARPDKLDRPLFKAVYTYPTDLKIEPPAVDNPK